MNLIRALIGNAGWPGPAREVEAGAIVERRGVAARRAAATQAEAGVGGINGRRNELRVGLQIIAEPRCGRDRDLPAPIQVVLEQDRARRVATVGRDGLVEGRAAGEVRRRDDDVVKHPHVFRRAGVKLPVGELGRRAVVVDRVVNDVRVAILVGVNARPAVVEREVVLHQRPPVIVVVGVENDAVAVGKSRRVGEPRHHCFVAVGLVALNERAALGVVLEVGDEQRAHPGAAVDHPPRVVPHDVVLHLHAVGANPRELFHCFFLVI